MAIYRQVHISFWEDTKVTDDFTAEDKYFMLYLLTNTKTNLLGCYEISPKQAAYDLGYSVDCVRNLFERFEKVHKIIVYNHQNKEILIKNWGKYNWNQSPKLEKALLRQLEMVKTKEFKVWLKEVIEQKEIVPYPCDSDRVSIGYPYTMDTTVTDTVNNISNINTNINNINNIHKEDKLDHKEAFEIFWKEYPRKVSKEKSRQWFAKNKPNRELLDKILASLKKHKLTRQWQDPQYIPHPITWLNQKRWEDEVDCEPKTKTVKPVPDWYSDYERQVANFKPYEEHLSDEEVEKIFEDAKNLF